MHYVLYWVDENLLWLFGRKIYQFTRNLATEKLKSRALEIFRVSIRLLDGTEKKKAKDNISLVEDSLWS